MKNILILFISLFITIGSIAQPNLDSLWEVWNDKNQPDTNRLKAIHKIAFDGYMFSYPDSAFYFAQIQYEFAEKIGNNQWMDNAQNLKTTFYINKKEYDSAFDLLYKCLKRNQKSGNRKEIGLNYKSIGDVYFKQDNYFSAKDLYLKSQNIFKEIKYDHGIIITQKRLGDIYITQGKYIKALNCYENILELNKNINDSSIIADCYIDIANIYISQNDINNAIEYLNNSLIIQKKINDLQGVALCYNNLGGIYFELNDYRKALEYHERSFTIRESIGDKSGIATSLVSIGIIERQKGTKSSYRIALKYFNKSLKIREMLNEKVKVAACLLDIGEIYRWQNKFNQALPFFYKSLKTATEIGAVIQIRDARKLLYKTYKSVGNDNKALKMYELYITMRDSIVDSNISKAIVEQKMKHEFEIKEQERLFQEKENIQIAKEQIQEKVIMQYVQYAAILISVILITMIVLTKRNVNISFRVIENMIFFNFFILFELLILIIDPLITKNIYDAPIILLIINSTIAILIILLHSLIVNLLRSKAEKKTRKI